MWADFLSHFQEEADGGAAYNEADVGQDDPEQEQYSQVTTQQYQPPQPAEKPEEAKTSLAEKIGQAAVVSVAQAMAEQDDHDGGSGGTSKMDDDEVYK